MARRTLAVVLLAAAACACSSAEPAVASDGSPPAATSQDTAVNPPMLGAPGAQDPETEQVAVTQET